MALCTELKRDGERFLPLDASGGKVGWSFWHCMRLQEAMKAEIGLRNWVEDAEHNFPSSYVFTHEHHFEAPEKDIWMGQVEDAVYAFDVKPGDEYSCWRDR